MNIMELKGTVSYRILKGDFAKSLSFMSHVIK